MLALTSRQIATATGGQLLFGSEDLVATSAVVDSRAVAEGSVFFALAGERTDGHRHIGAAIGAGARVIVLTDTTYLESLRESLDPSLTALIVVHDAVQALQLLAACHRTMLGRTSDVAADTASLLAARRCQGGPSKGAPITVVGVTGSTGKTSAKSFISSVLAQRFEVVATEGNQNNEIGCPLTILRANERTQVIVVEMGMRARGEIAELCAIARPRIGVVTGVGPVHLERLGTVENVARAKGELLQALPADGFAVIDGGGEFADLLASLCAAPVISVSASAGSAASILASGISIDETGCASATVTSASATFEPFVVRVPIPGIHHLLNALFAVAVGSRLGMDGETIARGIAATTIPGMRFAPIHDAVRDVTFINDAYNANPTSMLGSLSTFSTVSPASRHLVVLGDMLELGEFATRAHREVGERAATLGFSEVFAIGEHAGDTAAGARDADDPVEVRTFGVGDHAALAGALSDALRPGDYVLLKGSRGMALEQILTAMGVVTDNSGME